MPNSATSKPSFLPRVHPLDPLSPLEISETSRLIRSKYPGRPWIFNSITLKEPPKAQLLLYMATENEDRNNNSEQIIIPRRSFTLLIERFSGKVYEATTNLSEKQIEEFTEPPFGSQPTFTIEDSLIAEDIVKKDVEVQKRCAKIGIEDMDSVVSDPW
jgi:primary-amine oxidase